MKDPSLQKNGRFDGELWRQLNGPADFDGYRSQALRVPLYINSGDHDRFDIVYHAAVLYRDLLHLQPDSVEYRVVDGDHEWPVWEQTIGDALVYTLARVKAPQVASAAAGGGRCP